MSCQTSPRATAAGMSARCPNRKLTGAGATQPKSAKPKNAMRLMMMRRRVDHAKGGSANEMGPERAIALYFITNARLRLGRGWGKAARGARRRGKNGNAAVAGCVYRADAEDYVVLGDGELDRGCGACGLRHRPRGICAVAPDDLVNSTGRHAFGGLPSQLGVVVERGGEDVDVLWNAGSGGQGSQRCRVEAGYVCDVVEVDVLEEIAVLDAVFDADVLVLMIEVFAPLGEADSGEAFHVKAGVVAATEETVATEDEDGREGGQ